MFSALVVGAGTPFIVVADGSINASSLFISGPVKSEGSDLYLNNSATSDTTTPYIDFETGSSNEWVLAGSSIGSSPYFFNFISSNGTVDQFDSNGLLIINAPSGYSGNLINLGVNGISQFSVNAYGLLLVMVPLQQLLQEELQDQVHHRQL